jgi:hypothetical protein
MMDGALLLAAVGDVVPCQCTSEQRRVATRLMCQFTNIARLGYERMEQGDTGIVIFWLINYSAARLFVRGRLLVPLRANGDEWTNKRSVHDSAAGA